MVSVALCGLYVEIIAGDARNGLFFYFVSSHLIITKFISPQCLQYMDSITVPVAEITATGSFLPQCLHFS
jgi:hypothetical protein